MKYLVCGLLALSIVSSCKKDEAPRKNVESAIELVLTDRIPAEVSKIRLTNVSDNSFSETTIHAEDIGKSGISVLLPVSDVKEVEAAVSVYYTGNKTSTIPIHAVKVEPGKKTVISGSLSSFKVEVNGAWDPEDIVIEF